MCPIEVSQLISEIRDPCLCTVTAGAYEVGMQQLQETRTAAESMFNIGAGALISGVLGSIGRQVPQAERAAVLDTVRSEAGAGSCVRRAERHARAA